MKTNSRFAALITLFIFCITISFGQNKPECGTMDYLNLQLINDSSLKEKMQIEEQKMQRWILQNKNTIKSTQNLITVPVVVHIVYNTPEQNISDQQVEQQIATLNVDFAGLNPNSMEGFSNDLKVNTDIQFCLARRTNTNIPSNGIERRSTNVIEFTKNDNVKFYSNGGLDAWDPNKYFNIWVCNLEDDLLGYAQFPSSGINSTYGVVIDYEWFGNTGLSLGATATHEIGHCFNLKHIWGDDQCFGSAYSCQCIVNSCCWGSDDCSDTPDQAIATGGIPSQPITDDCSPDLPGIMYMNFMDYTSDFVLTNFTPNQKERIQACFSTEGPLHPLLVSNGCQILLPDLTILNPIISPTSAHIGSSINTLCTVRNLGPGNEENGSILKYYLSS